MKHILITGGMGLIGTNIIKGLKKKYGNNCKIVVIDSCELYPVLPEINTKEELEVYYKNKAKDLNVDLYKIRLNGVLYDDMKEFLGNLKVLLNNKLDYIFHLASPASPMFFEEYPIETLDDIMFGTRIVSIIAKNFVNMGNFINIFYASTSEVYGDVKVLPTDEYESFNLDVRNIRTNYAFAKLYSEKILINLANELSSKINLYIGRIFNTYGTPLYRDGRLIQNLVISALFDTPFMLHNKGKSKRSFCYVEDLVNEIFELIFQPSKVKGAIEIVNLGNSKEYYSIKKVTNIFQKVINRKIFEIQQGETINEPSLRRPNLTRLKYLTGYKPSIKLEEGLKKTWEEMNNEF